MLCGTYGVYEDRERRSGRMISLNIAVLPAFGLDPDPDPVFWLAGGPGVASTAGAAMMSTSPFRWRRDIVMVDQRGTGGSNPLPCPLARGRDDLQGYVDPYFQDLDLYRECLLDLQQIADLRLYTTEIFIDDLDEVRDALGYERINLYAGSWGTRAALVYLRRHPASIRAAVINAVAPPAFVNPLYHARAAQQAIERLFADCDRDQGCTREFPDLREKFEIVLATLERQPAQVTIAHPDTGVSVPVSFSRDAFAEAIRSISYSESGRQWVPWLIHLCWEGNYAPLAEWYVAHNRRIERDIHWGLLLSVICSEDIPRIDPAAIPALTLGTYYGDYRVRSQMRACQLWPTGTVDAGYGNPVTSDVPTLLWSGIADPVTPPQWGDEAARHLSDSLHLIVNTAHFVRGECYEAITRRFIDDPSVLTSGPMDEILPDERRRDAPTAVDNRQLWTACADERWQMLSFILPGR